MCNENETNASKVLKYLTDMSSISGNVLNPIALAHFALEKLEKRKSGVTNAPETARNTAYVYACLCNEYMLMANNKSVEKADEFYVPDWKWGKYKIGRSLKERIPLLVDLGWIQCREGGYGNRDYYKINIDKLRRMSENTKGFRSEKKLDDWLDKFFEALRKDKINGKTVYDQMTIFLKNNETEEV